MLTPSAQKVGSTFHNKVLAALQLSLCICSPVLRGLLRCKTMAGRWTDKNSGCVWKCVLLKETQSLQPKGVYRKDLWFLCNGLSLSLERHFVGRHGHLIQGTAAAAPGVLLCCHLPRAVCCTGSGDSTGFGGSAGSAAAKPQLSAGCGGLQRKDKKNKLLVRTSSEKYLETDRQQSSCFSRTEFIC